MYVKKRGSFVARKAQIAVEHLLLTGFVLVLLIPLLFFASQDKTKTPYMADAVNTLDNTVESLSNLGIGSSDTVVVNIPGGIKSVAFADCKVDAVTTCKAINVTYGGGKNDLFIMEYFVGGSLEFFYTSGIHYITMFNDGKNQQIVFQECGDGFVTGGEQCEVCTVNEDCASGEACDSGVCTFKGVKACTQGCFPVGSEFGCFCQCNLDSECLVGICLDGGFCSGCESDNDCNSGECCSLGVCGACGPVCGNGAVEVGEACDDANLVNGDGCNLFCENEVCAVSNSYALVQAFSTFNSHVATLEKPQISGGTCFNVTENLAVQDANRNCDGTNRVMYVDSLDGNNAHITPPELAPPSAYQEVCYDGITCKSILSVLSCSSLGPTYECILSFKGAGGSQFNAHVATCNEPLSSYKLCCGKP